MTEWLRFGLCAACTLIGLLVFITGVLGIYRFRFVLNRMHSAALIDTMGLFFIVLGLAVKRGFDMVTVKLLIVVAVLWLTSPLASHLLAKMEFFTDRTLEKEIQNPLKDVKGEGEDGSDDL